MKSGTSDEYRTEYTWDHRNRLTKVTFKDNSGTITKVVDHTYDTQNNWLSRTVDHALDNQLAADWGFDSIDPDGLERVTAGYSTVWERRLQQLLAIRDQHLAEGLPEEARRVEETIREEWANKTGRHLDEGEMHVFEAMIARNAEKSAAIVDVLALPSRVATACFGTTPEELANALALAGGDAYVESGVLVEYAPGLYRMQMKYAPSEHENYWKYRLGVDVVADPFTYTPLVGQKTNRRPRRRQKIPAPAGRACPRNKCSAELRR